MKAVETLLLERGIAAEDLDDIKDALEGVAGILSPEDAVMVPFGRTEHWPQRYNTGSFSALYTALDYPTCLAEIAYHLTGKVTQGVALYYQVLQMKFDGTVFDLCGHETAKPELISQTSAGYPFCQTIAVAARTAGADGLRAPSARNVGGVCIPIFAGKAISGPKITQKLRFTFDGVRLEHEVL